MTQTFQPGDALIVVDVQNDFCPGGALPIENGNTIIPVLNRWIADATLPVTPEGRKDARKKIQDANIQIVSSSSV